MKEKLITIREASLYLGITERQVVELTEKGVIPAYKVGGAYLRFRKEQLDYIKEKIKPTIENNLQVYSFRDKVSDFFYYNDFYIFSFLVISILIFLIFNL